MNIKKFIDSETSDYIRAIIALYCFISIVLIFPSGEPLVFNGNLINFWLIPAFFLLVRAIHLKLILDDKKLINPFVPKLFAAAANGTWTGLSVGSVFILNEWYRTPDLGHYEPLLVATSLSSAASIYAFKELNRIAKMCERRVARENNIISYYQPKI